MSQTILFKTAQGTAVTRDDLRAALEQIQADDAQVLYLHTGLSFGLPNPELSREELLDSMYQAIRGLNVRTLCVPTFTFSFCNGEAYDSARSKTRMGALNEFIRRRPEAVRSVDPLMSVAVIGEDLDLAQNLGHESIGTDSTFDKLSRRTGVKFLFMGVSVGDCLTYMHYLEWVAGVPYRYDREFTGTITHAGRTYEDTYKLFVRYNNVQPNKASYDYEQLMADRGMLRVAALGNHSVRCIAEPDARSVYLELLEMDPNYFIENPFSPQDADPTFTLQKMVSL